MLRRIIKNAMIVLCVYVFGLPIRGLFLLLVILGIVKITNLKDLPKLKPGMVFVFNHADTFDCMAEIFFGVALFLPQILRHPLKFAPLFAPDKGNFTDKWWWSWLKLFAVPITRGNGTANGAKEAHEMLDAVKHGRIMFYFIEPGRTCTGKEFIYSPSGRRKIRKPTQLVGSALLIDGISVVAIWIDNGDVPVQPGKPLFSSPNLKRGPATITIGQQIKRSKDWKRREEATIAVVGELLQCADKGSS